jgi:DNA polymerase-3 subunit delta'
MAKKVSSKGAGGRGPRVVDLTQERSASKAAERAGLAVPAPIGLENLVGHERAIGVLERAVASGQVAHAWIFHGPRGVGKFTAAVSFAALLLDPTTGPGLTGHVAPDPESEAARLLREGTHPGLLVVRKELARWSREADVRSNKLTTIPVDVVREFFIEPAALAPSMPGGRADKVFIVDEAELLGKGDRSAANAMLKTLEEPRPGTVIVLVTTSEERLLPTIRSRCQRVAFTPLAGASMRAWLEGWARGPEHELADDEREFLLSFADGAPGRAVTAASEGLFGWHTRLAPMLAMCDAGKHPAELGATMQELAEEWAKGHVAAGEKIGENRSKEAASAWAASLVFGVVAARYRQQMMGARGGRGEVFERGARAAELIAEAEGRLASNVNGLFVYDALAAGLSSGLGEPAVGV